MNDTIKSMIFSLFVLFLFSCSQGAVGFFSFPPSSHSTGNNLNSYEYHSYESMTECLITLSEQYPDIVRLESIGTTYEGRSIWMMKISDNPDQDENEPAVFFMGAHHGNEKPSYESLIFFLEFIVKTYYDEGPSTEGIIGENLSKKRIRSIVNSTEIFVIPMVNPDGVEYNWRKNRAPNYGSFGMADEITSYGVDLNRNYGYLWHLPFILPLRYMLPFIIADQSWIYRGPHPFSELETKAIRDFVESKDNIKISLSYHTYGEVIFYPWMHTSLSNPDEEIFISIGENISLINHYDLRIHGWSNREFIIPRFAGTIGTSENWLYATQGIFSFTMELCKTRAPTDPELLYDCFWKHVGVNLYTAERASHV